LVMDDSFLGRSFFKILLLANRQDALLQ